jgi:hypothetical protein
MSANESHVILYTDGACSGNPGPGGWAALLLVPGQRPRLLVGSHPDTTNNRMELTAVQSRHAPDAPRGAALLHGFHVCHDRG